MLPWLVDFEAVPDFVAPEPDPDLARPAPESSRPPYPVPMLASFSSSILGFEPCDPDLRDPDLEDSAAGLGRSPNHESTFSVDRVRRLLWDAERSAPACVGLPWWEDFFGVESSASSTVGAWYEETAGAFVFHPSLRSGPERWLALLAVLFRDEVFAGSSQPPGISAAKSLAKSGAGSSSGIASNGGFDPPLWWDLLFCEALWLPAIASGASFEWRLLLWLLCELDL